MSKPDALEWAKIEPWWYTTSPRTGVCYVVVRTATHFEAFAVGHKWHSAGSLDLAKRWAREFDDKQPAKDA